MLSSTIECLIPLAHCQHTGVEVLMPLYLYTAFRRASAPPAGLLGQKVFLAGFTCKHEFHFLLWKGKNIRRRDNFQDPEAVLFLNASSTCSHRGMNADEQDYLLIKSGVKWDKLFLYY